jgi:hypothetical protein
VPWILLANLLTINSPCTDAAHEAIEVVQKKFTTGIRSFPNGTLYRSFDPTERVFVGPPSADVDANWDALVDLDSTFCANYMCFD